MDPLAQLRDIHQPAMIESWPPAPGWWLLAALGLAVVIAVIVWAYRHWHANRYRREAERELSDLLADWRLQQDDFAYLQSLQLLLKRVALTRFPREDVASLTGEAWVQFLDRSTGSHDFSMGETEVLIDGNYRTNATINVEALQHIALKWIKKHDVRHLRLLEKAA
jgi:hypothetical protein